MPVAGRSGTASQGLDVKVALVDQRVSHPGERGRRGLLVGGRGQASGGPLRVALVATPAQGPPGGALPHGGDHLVATAHQVEPVGDQDAFGRASATALKCEPDKSIHTWVTPSRHTCGCSRSQSATTSAVRPGWSRQFSPSTPDHGSGRRRLPPQVDPRVHRVPVDGRQLLVGERQVRHGVERVVQLAHG